jgi:hypothetical protein
MENCDDCLYKDVHISDEPCGPCDAWSNWKPKEEKIMENLHEIICAWCGKHMGWIKDCKEDSHGICHDCAEKIREKLKQDEE